MALRITSASSADQRVLQLAGPGTGVLIAPGSNMRTLAHEGKRPTPSCSCASFDTQYVTGPDTVDGQMITFLDRALVVRVVH